MPKEIKYPVELKITFTITESGLDRLRLTPERYVRFIRDSIYVRLLSDKSFIPHSDVKVTVEH